MCCQERLGYLQSVVDNANLDVSVVLLAVGPQLADEQEVCGCKVDAGKRYGEVYGNPGDVVHTTVVRRTVLVPVLFALFKIPSRSCCTCMSRETQP